MSEQITHVWVYLSSAPLLWLTATLVAYLAGDWIYRTGRRNPLLNPVALASAFLIALLLATGTEHETYFEGAKFVHFLLGPATVALAVPLYTNFGKVRQVALPMTLALVAGSATAVASAVSLAWLLGASPETVASIAPKSVTTPIAMGVSEATGGLPSLTAALVMLTGILGAMTVRPLLNLLRIRDWRARGFSAGTAIHGMGTAMAFQVSELAGTFAGIAMALNGLVTSVLAPILIGYFG